MNGMPQTNPFYIPHNTLESLLSNAGNLLQQPVLGSDRLRCEADESLQVLVKTLEKYSDAVNQHFLTVLSLFEPGVADSVLQQQTEMVQSGKKLMALFQEHINFLPLADKKAGSQALAAFFESYRELCNRYLHREEAVVCSLLRRYCTDAELEQLVRQIMHQSGLASQPVLPFCQFNKLSPGEIGNCPSGEKRRDKNREKRTSACANQKEFACPRYLLPQTLAWRAMAVEG